MSEYAERDYRGLDDHYIKHVAAMTEEGLHSKAAIAAELAHRDCQIQDLTTDNSRFIGYLNYLGIDPMDGSPTAEVIVGMRIQELERNEVRLREALEKIGFQLNKNDGTGEIWLRARLLECKTTALSALAQEVGK